MPVITKHNFTQAGTITLDIIDSLLANGFKAIFPISEGTGAYVRPTNTEKFNVTLEATGTIDPLNKEGVAVKQPWRINFTVYDNATMGITLGSQSALGADGKSPAFLNSVSTGTGSDIQINTRFGGLRGVVGNNYTPLRPAGADRDIPNPLFFATYDAIKPHFNNVTEGFINRRKRVWADIRLPNGVTTGSIPAETEPLKPSDPAKDISASLPMSYHLVTTPRGIFLAVWEGTIADAAGTNFSWVLVQRPVDRDTGETIITGKAPVFAVSSVGNVIRRFVVRESDRVDASPSVLASVDSVDASAIINEKIQVGVSEDNTYVVNFPSRLNTPRYGYTYELDIIGYTSASVVSNETSVPVKLYNEDDERTYFGMFANQKDNNGMRIVALQTGGGV